jgi:hypothetical protein
MSSCLQSSLISSSAATCPANRSTLISSPAISFLSPQTVCRQVHIDTFCTGSPCITRSPPAHHAFRIIMEAQCPEDSVTGAGQHEELRPSPWSPQSRCRAGQTSEHEESHKPLNSYQRFRLNRSYMPILFPHRVVECASSLSGCTVGTRCQDQRLRKKNERIKVSHLLPLFSTSSQPCRSCC